MLCQVVLSLAELYPPRRRLRNGDGNGDGMRTEMRTGWGQVHTNRQVMHACKARTAPAACMYALGTSHACRQSIVTCYAPPSIYMSRTIGGTLLHLMWPPASLGRLRRVSSEPWNNETATSPMRSKIIWVNSYIMIPYWIQRRILRCLQVTCRM